MNRLVTSGEVAESDDRNQPALSKALSLNTEAGKDIAISIPEDAEATPTKTEAEHEQTSKGDRESMHKAATEGDWAEAETLLRRDADLGWVDLTEQGDTALHLAVSRNHTQFVHELIGWLESYMLYAYDGQGYTACCYAAMAGNLDVLRIVMEFNPYLPNVKNWYGTTPLALAISHGKAEIVKYFLDVAELEGVKEKEWFDLFLDAIDKRMFDAASKILERKGNLAEMKDAHKRTALHVLAQLDISIGWKTGDDEKRQLDDACSLAEKLWGNIQHLQRGNVLELMRSPPILHDAAKAGNLYLIDMIIGYYSDLLSDVDPDGYSLSHVIVMNRRENMLELVKNARNAKNFNAISLDKDGNNLLHSAAKSPYPEGLETVAELEIEMQRAFDWFKEVGAIVPSIYAEMKNKKGYKPIELFFKEHAKMIVKSEAYVKKTAETCMLISTIVLTLVFAAAFAPPGGFNEQTGVPILLKSKWFTSFIVFKLLAMSSSTFSIISFWSIISSKTEDDQFLLLPHYLRISMCALLLSVLFVTSAFLSVFFLVFAQERIALSMSFILPVYGLFVLVIFYQITKVLSKTDRHSLIELFRTRVLHLKPS